MKKYVLSLFLALTCLIATLSSKAQKFNHPGILCSQSELDFIKAKVLANEAPYLARFNAVKSSINLNHTPYDWSKGPLKDSDQSGQFSAIRDAEMIEKCAYVGFISGDTRYYDLAMKILRNMYKFTSEGDALEINWTSFPMLSGAEILRIDPIKSGFTTAEQAKLNTLISKAPSGTERYSMRTATDQESPYGGNWLFSSYLSRIALAVYTDNRALFENAYLETSQMLSTNIYLKTDGKFPVRTDTYRSVKNDAKYGELNNWMGATLDDLYDGFHGEACRDLNHALRIGTKRTFQIAQIATLQNNSTNDYDFYGQHERRISAFLELFAGWMTTVPIPATMCGGRGQFGQTVEGQFNCNGDLKGIAKGNTPCQEKVFFGYTYPHFIYRLDHQLPYTKAMHEADNTYRLKQGDMELLLYREPLMVVKQGTQVYTDGSTYTFPATDVNSTSTAVLFTISNEGNFLFNLKNITINGVNKDEFTISNVTPTTIAGPSNQTVTFQVTFKPKSAGSKTAAVTVLNTANPNGSYVINLKGSTSGVVVTNKAPIVSITSPSDQASFILGETISLAATATDDGAVNRVNFKLNNAYYSTDNTAPYTGTWTPTSVGQYKLAAIAFDDQGLATEVFITVNIVAGNQAPTVSFSTPVGGSFISLGQTVNLEANANDPDGTISKVNLKINDTFYAQLTTAPFVKTWTPTTVGQYKLSAVAWDDKNLATETFIIVNVEKANETPNVKINYPLNGAVYTIDEEIEFNATATDNDGTIEKINFKINGAYFAQSTDIPYTKKWAPTTAGDYTVSARAFDDQGLSTEVSVTITVKNIITDLGILYNSTPLTLYPNPSNTGFYILSTKVHYEVYTLTGNQLISTESNSIDLSSFANGIYILKVENATVKLYK